MQGRRSRIPWLIVSSRVSTLSQAPERNNANAGRFMLVHSSRLFHPVTSHSIVPGFMCSETEYHGGWRSLGRDVAPPVTYFLQETPPPTVPITS